MDVISMKTSLSPDCNDGCRLKCCSWRWWEGSECIQGPLQFPRSPPCPPPPPPPPLFLFFLQNNHHFSPSANLIRSALSPLYRAACVSDTEPGSEGRQRAGESQGGKRVLPFSLFSLDVQREVFHTGIGLEKWTLLSHEILRLPNSKRSWNPAAQRLAGFREWENELICHGFIITSWDWVTFPLTLPRSHDDWWGTTSRKAADTPDQASSPHACFPGLHCSWPFQALSASTGNFWEFWIKDDFFSGDSIMAHYLRGFPLHFRELLDPCSHVPRPRNPYEPSTGKSPQLIFTASDKSFINLRVFMGAGADTFKCLPRRAHNKWACLLFKAQRAWGRIDCQLMECQDVHEEPVTHEGVKRKDSVSEKGSLQLQRGAGGV